MFNTQMTRTRGSTAAANVGSGQLLREIGRSVTQQTPYYAINERYRARMKTFNTHFKSHIRNSQMCLALGLINCTSVTAGAEVYRHYLPQT